MSSEFDFSSLEEICIPVTVPDGVKYVLCEADGDTVVAFNNARAASAKIKDGAVVGVSGPGHVEPLLVSRCLFPADAGDSTKPVKTRPDPHNSRKSISNHVSESLVRSWPGKVQTKLYEKAKEISEIDQDTTLEALTVERNRIDKLIEKMEVNAAKNEPTSTETGLD